MTSRAQWSGGYAGRLVGVLAVALAGTGMLAPRPVLGQSPGSVEGTVVDDAGGAPLAAAVVTLEETGASATTGPDGRFAIEDVPPGVYTLSVILEGFAPLVTPVTVTPGAPSLLDLRVPSAAFEESVLVAGVISEVGLRQETDTGSRLGLEAFDIPASIGVIDSATMQRRGYWRLSDAVEKTAGIIVGQFPAEPSSFSLRGFTRSQITVLRDNIWLGPANMTMRRQNTFNLDRVEVMRGPSSVINGQGAVAGTINAVTKQAEPTTVTEWSGLLSYGSFNTYQTSFGVNGPASDTVFYRFDVSRYASDGFVERMEPHSSNVTGSLLWRPGDRGQLRVNVDYLKDDAGSYFGTPLLPRDAPGVEPLNVITTQSNEVVDGRLRFRNYNVDDAVAGAETFLFRVDGDVLLSDNVTFRNTLYTFNATRNWQNAEGFPYCGSVFLDLYGANVCPRPNTIQRFYGYFFVDHDQDLIGNRAQFEVRTPVGGGLENRVVLGAEASRLDFERSRGYRLSADPLEGDLVDLLDPTPGRYGPREMVGVSPTFIRQWAVFLEDSLPVGDRFRLTGAMRFDGMSLDRQNLSPPPDLQLDADSSFTRDFRWFSWRAGAVVNLHADVVAYGQISNAKDPVGDDLFLVNSGHDYDLTDARQLEVGLKADVGGHTEVTAAVFDMERDDVLESYGPDSVYTIGGIESRGVELSMVSRPNANAYFGASVAVTNAELVAGANVDRFAGNKPGNVPANVSQVWFSYSDIGGSPVEVGASARAVADRWATAANRVSMNGYAVADTWLALNFPNARLSFNVFNLADTAYASWAHHQYISNLEDGEWELFYANQLMLGPPRTFSVTLSTGF